MTCPRCKACPRADLRSDPGDTLHVAPVEPIPGGLVMQHAWQPCPDCAPVRLRLSRARGFDLQALSRAVNDRPAVVVARPSRWGNPFPWRGDWIVWAAVAAGFRADEAGRRAASVAFHRAWLGQPAAPGPLADHHAACPRAGLRPDPGGGILEFTDGTTRSFAEHARGLAAGIAHLYRDTIDLPPPPARGEIAALLAGRNVACWCALCPAHAVAGRPIGLACPDCAPCHADTLGEIANG
jgi:hypothetical protein